jgi:hypothetical protein
MFFPPRWEEEEARVLAPAVKNFTSRSRWVTSVRTLHVPYVQVQHRHLGVTRLLGLKLLALLYYYTTIYMRGEYRLDDAHFWRAHYCTCPALIHRRYTRVLCYAQYI